MIEIQPFIFYLVIGEAAILGLFLGLVTISYLNLIKKYARLEKERLEAEKEVKQKLLESQKVAEKQAQEVIGGATVEAKDILNSAQDVAQQLKIAFSQELSKLSQSQSKLYEELSKEAKAEMLKMIQSISKDIERSMETEIIQFRNLLRQEVLREQVELREKINEEYETVEKEIEMYKQQKIRKIDGAVFEIVRDIAQKVIGRALSIDEHEELVLKSLEIAKREHVL